MQLNPTAGIIDLISNLLLITGAATQARVCLLPAMIINVFVNIVLWVLAMAVLLLSAATLDAIIGMDSDLARVPPLMNFIASLGGAVFVVIALIAVIHLLLLKVIIAHYGVIGEEKQRQQFQPIINPSAFVNISSHAFALHPSAPPPPVPSDQAFFTNEKPIYPFITETN